MVRFIVGKADKNISAAVRGELISLLAKANEKQKIIYIVPDQFEYETEKAVYRVLEKNKELLKRFFNVNITTFTRLCHEILEECGEHRPFADDIVKDIIMHKTVCENSSVLSTLDKVAARPGFCGKMVKTVSALKTAGITARDLDICLNALTTLDNGLSPDQPVVKKLIETNMLYTNYEALLSKYVDKLDVTSMAADNIEKEVCDKFENASVFVDCFNDFTQSQLHFLECVILRAENVTFGFTAQLKSDCDVFRTANDHIARLKRCANDAGLSVELDTEEIESRFADNSPLRGLSLNLFQSEKNCDPLKDSLELVTARGVYDELDYTAAKIKELTIDKKMRYNEIAVLCTDVGKYGKYVESAFKKYDIPLFLDTPEPILYQPLINLVNSILNALSDFSVDTVLSCVKTKFFSKPKPAQDKRGDEPEISDDDDLLSLFEGLEEIEDSTSQGKMTQAKSGDRIALSDKDADVFESYIYEWDLKTSHLKNPFTFKNKRNETDFDQQTAEQVRQAVAVPILELRNSLLKNGKTIDGAEITEQLYDFLVKKVGMWRALYKRCKNEQNDALDADKVALYQRLWNSLIDIINKLHTELAGTPITLSEYGDLFREICAATKLAVPPHFIDCVLVGDIDRTRADNIRAAFIVGASYEAFPTPASESGIFSQYEIELIHDKIIHIEGDPETADIRSYIETIERIGNNNRREYCLKTEKDQYYLSLYRAYRAITLPTEYLCISCPKNDISGEELVHSDVFTDIISTFRDVNVIAAESRDNEFYCRTPKAAKMRYAMGLNEQSEENMVLRKVFEREDNEFVTALDDIRELRRDKAVGDKDRHFSGEHTIDLKTAKLLFRRSLAATYIEKLNKCKFNYFCEYGLKIRERDKRSFTRIKRGVAMHFIIQKTLEEYKDDMNAFFALKRSELLSLTKKYLSEFRETETNNDNTEDKRTEYLFNNVANSAVDVLITMQTELFARKYRPKFFELDIGSDTENNKQPIISNEDRYTTIPPEAELISAEEIPAAPRRVDPDKNAPYLITAPLTIKLDDDSEVTVQGIIDRIDMICADKNDNGKTVAYVRVVDYKSSVHTFDLKNAQNGINIQMLLYLFALQSSNEDNSTLELHPGGVNYIPSNNNGASDEPLSPYRLLAMNYHESGLFIKDDVTEEDLEGYQKVIFNKFENDSTIAPEDLEKIKKSFTPKYTNTAEAKFFEQLREDVMKKISENLSAIFSGKIDALPTTYYEYVIKPDGGEKTKYNDPCEKCRFSDICQNAGKNVNKIGKTQLKPQKVKTNDKREFWENKYIGKEDSSNGK